jgi:hypothetical protein
MSRDISATSPETYVLRSDTAGGIVCATGSTGPDQHGRVNSIERQRDPHREREPGFARLDGRERLKARWPVSSCLAPYSARLSIPLIKAREQHAVEQHKRREPGCR